MCKNGLGIWREWERKNMLRVYRITVDGNRRRGRQQKMWRVEMNELSMRRGEWRREMIERDRMIFTGDTELWSGAPIKSE